MRVLQRNNTESRRNFSPAITQPSYCASIVFLQWRDCNKCLEIRASMLELVGKRFKDCYDGTKMVHVPKRNFHKKFRHVCNIY